MVATWNFFIIHKNKKFLLSMIPYISRYLKNTVGVTLHPKKIYLQPCSRGVTYLGCHVKPWGFFLSKRTKSNMERLMREVAEMDFSTLHQDEIKIERSRCDSYFGQRWHYDIFNSFSQIYQKKRHLNLLKFFIELT